MWLLSLAFVLIIVGTSCTRVDDNAAANQRFVETGQLLKKATLATPADAIRLYEQALQHLDHIVATYPTSTLAVQIISDQSIGEVSRTGIKQSLLKARQEECAHNPRSACILAEALETAYGISENHYRATAFGEIAEAQVQSGQQGQARTTLATALEAARNINDSDKGSWPGQRAMILQGLAPIQAQVGESPIGLEIARSLEDGEMRVTTLCAIAQAQLDAGQKGQASTTLATATETARDIGDHAKRAQAFGALAITQAKAGNTGEANASLATALQLAHKIKVGYQRDGALRTIVEAQAKVGDIPAALEVAQDIKDNYLHALALHAIARVQVAIGKKDDADHTLGIAFNFARDIKDRSTQLWTLCDIAIVFAATGDIDNALATTRDTEGKENKCRDRVSHAIAVAQAKAGDIPTALQTARSIETTGWRAVAFSDIAAMQAKAGNKVVARKTFTTALETARRVDENWNRVSVLTSIGTSLIGIDLQ